MRVLYVGHTYTIEANQAKLQALARLPGIEVLLLTPHGWKGPLYENVAHPMAIRANLRHQTLPARFIGRESLYFFTGHLSQAIKSFAPDLIHVEQGSYALSYAQVLRTAVRLAPNARATFFSWWNLPTPVRGIKRLLQNYNFRHSACAIAGNSAAREVLRSQGFGRPIYVIPQLGVDVPFYAEALPDPTVREQHRLASFVVGYVGRVSEEKGVMDLVDAMAGTRESMTLLVVGNGEAVQPMIARARTHDVHLVHLPAVRNEQIPAILKQLDVLALPSRATKTWEEQFGHILIEAMAARVPVIGAATGEIPNVIGSDGIVLPPEDPLSLRQAIQDLFHNPALLSTLAARGHERVLVRYTHDRIAEQQMAVYEWMLEEGTAVRAST